VLVATPLKNAEPRLGGFAAALRRLTYPKSLLSVAFLVSDSTDQTALVARQLARDVLWDFADVQVYEQDFHYEAPADRHSFAAQAARRKVLARSRNALLLSALTQDLFAVLWLDADVVHFPETFVQDLLSVGKPVVAPHVRIGDTTYDRNSWREEDPEHAFAPTGPDVVFEGYKETKASAGRRVYMDDFRAAALAGGVQDTHFAVRLDGVGTAALLVEARVYRDERVLFPEQPYKHRLESEGFGLLAADHGFPACGLPLYDVRHWDEWAAERKLAAVGSNSTNGTMNSTRTTSEAPETSTTSAGASGPTTATSTSSASGMPTTTSMEKEVRSIVQMTVNSEMLANVTAMETLTNAAAETIAEKAGVPRESVSVEVSEDRRLQSESSGKVILKLVYTIVVPEGSDASVIASTIEAIEPKTLTTAVNQALSAAQVPYETIVDGITAAVISHGATPTSKKAELGSSISMHGSSCFALVLVTAAMAWGAN